MNCNECSDLLDYYIESELDAKNLESVETHLDFCANCARSYRKLVEEKNLYGQYLVNVQASPQLWTNLQEQFEKAQRPAFRQPFTYFRKLFSINHSALNFKPSHVAALLLIIVMLGIAGLLKYKFSGNQVEQNYTALPENVDANPKPESKVARTSNGTDEDSNDKQTLVSQKNPSAGVENRRRKNTLPFAISKRIVPAEISKTGYAALKKSNVEVIGQAERQYQNAIAVLTRDIIKRRREELPSNALSQTNEVLTDLDRTIEKTRRAVREQPQNPVAVQYMTDAYAKKVELLRNILGK